MRHGRRWVFATLAAVLGCWPATVVASAADPFAGFSVVSQVWSFASLIQIAPDRRFLTMIGTDQVDIVALSSGTILRRLETGDGPITEAGISADSKTIVVRVAHGPQMAWDTTSGRLLKSVPEKVALEQLGDSGQPHPYTFKLSDRSDDRRAKIEIGNGSKSSVPLYADAPVPTCGYSLASPVFDGKYLVYGLHGGEDELSARMAASATELRNGSFRELWRSPCSDNVGVSEVLGDARYISLVEAPVGPVIVWDLHTNRIAATFENADGSVAISKDGGTIVASAHADDNLDNPVFKVLRAGRLRSFPRQMSEIDRLVLSPSGRWLAAQHQSSVVVWSTEDGRIQPKADIDGGEGTPQISAIADDGALTFTPDRHATHRGETVDAESIDGHWASLGNDIFDLHGDRRIAHLLGGSVEHFDENGRAVIRAAGTWRLLDLHTARPLWTLHISPRGYVLTFPDGCVQVAPGSERFVKLVRGFEERPYDAAAARVFAKPGCKGRPEAIATSEAAFAADQANLAWMTRQEKEKRRKSRRVPAR